MSFLKKTWLARLGVGLNRFRMNNSTDVVLESNPVSVTQQGDQLSADNMNNLETRIDNAFTEMAGNLATIEVSPSQHNWTVGSQIVYNGILYKVSSAISTGDNLVVDSNIERYPVSNAISDIIEWKLQDSFVIADTQYPSLTFPLWWREAMFIICDISSAVSGTIVISKSGWQSLPNDMYVRTGYSRGTSEYGDFYVKKVDNATVSMRRAYITGNYKTTNVYVYCR